MKATLVITCALISGITLGIPLQAAPPKADSVKKSDTARPRELGRVAWLRGFDSAAAKAAAVKKPLLVLFQEVPGCRTCVKYGDQVLSHPLIVEAADSLFVPVAVYNNIKGDDERTLKSFQEPAWNNPVVRIMTNDRTALGKRVAGDYSLGGMARAMVQGLGKHGRKVPAYLRLLAHESVARQLGVQRATFAMHCFWEGESALGRLPGVVSTVPGFLGKDEVVELEFDPRVIKYQELLSKAKAMDCASRVYTRNETQQETASRLMGSAALRSDDAIRVDSEPKYYMSQTVFKHLPMTALQAARVNAAIHRKQDPKRFLSPKQIAMLGVIEAHPDTKWPVAIGAISFPLAWKIAVRLAEAL